MKLPASDGQPARVPAATGPLGPGPAITGKHVVAVTGTSAGLGPPAQSWKVASTMAIIYILTQRQVSWNGVGITTAGAFRVWRGECIYMY